MLLILQEDTERSRSYNSKLSERALGPPESIIPHSLEEFIYGELE